jgi:hypothetical protein
MSARIDDGVERRALATQRRRHRLVDHRKARSRLSLADPDQAELRQRRQLDVRVVGGAGERQRPAGQLRCRPEVRHPVRACAPALGME